jgi:hypothetical protein
VDLAVGRSVDMTPWGDYRAKLVEIAERIASEGAENHADFLRRFRTVYRHLVVSVDGVANELGFGPFGPMPMEMPGMRPDVPRLLGTTDEEIDSL